MKIEFGPWTPDQPAFANPGCTEAKNVLPFQSSYGPFKTLRAFSGALTEPCLGAFWMPDLDSVANNFAGDQSKLYKYANLAATWSDVSRTTSYAAAIAWEFEKFGNRCIAVDIGTTPQYYDLGTSAFFNDLGGSPPKAKHVATVRDFLVLGNLESLPDTVRWSAFNNSDDWTASLATQSGSQELPGRGGAIQRIVPGEYGVIFQENSIWRMDYIGPPVVWQFDEVERGRGTPAPRSVVWFGSQVFYYDDAGFFAFDGVTSTPIGNNRVDNWFKNNSASLDDMVGAVDRRNRVVLWAFKSSSAQSYNDRIIMYNFATDRWAWSEITTQFLSERISGQLTLDELDTPLPGGIDVDSIPMDSPFGVPDLSIQAFDSSNRAGLFDGSAMSATIESREINSDEHSFETRTVRPLVDQGDVTVQIGYRNAQNASATYTNATSLNRLGEAPRRLNARFQRYRLNITNQFNQAQGVEIRGRQAGRR